MYGRETMLRYPITITIDTNIIDSTNYDLSDDSKLQVLLKLVKEGKVKVVLSDIVLREALSHLKKKTTKAYSQVRENRNQLLKIADESLINAVGLEKYVEIPDKEKMIKLAYERFHQYVSDLNVEVLDLSSIDINEIIDDYFEIRFPFENDGKKRKEFPDAFVINQIKHNYPDEASLVVLSHDKGFKAGCRRYGNYEILDSLDELFAKISKQDSQYELAVNMLKELDDDINKSIKEYVESEENISVSGQTVDKDGVIEGYDFSETLLHRIDSVSHRLHIIDDIEEDIALITLSCKADVAMDCYYEDYDNAPWDSEEKEYLFVDTVHLFERYNPSFACRIKINLKDKVFTVLPFRIVMGCSSKIESVVVDDRDND